jgi:hypothetical protein
MKQKKMKKIVLMMMTGLLILGFSASLQGKDHDKYRSDHRYYSDEYDRQGYSSHHQYNPRRNYPEDRRYYYKSHRQILKEIRKNERRIRKLEHKLRKYYRKKHYYSHYKRYKYHYYVRQIRHLEWQISRLVHRNRFLHKRLHR